MPKTAIAKVFMTGRSQAVRLPKAFRFKTGEVRIRAEGSRVILEPIPMDWDWLHDLHAMGPLDDDAVLSAKEDFPIQEREELDVFK
ncbi:MAG: AbrB/MazE/SpoVT family DNA-binding domain-containing protein [Gammaproteobacteria bacterium]|nr:AbrB/MazE/SpoVT family DNA-binding domain-containing protein [Gammaproteobacteria bacterium]